MASNRVKAHLFGALFIFTMMTGTTLAVDIQTVDSVEELRRIFIQEFIVNGRSCDIVSFDAQACAYSIVIIDNLQKRKSDPFAISFLLPKYAIDQAYFEGCSKVFARWVESDTAVRQEMNNFFKSIGGVRYFPESNCLDESCFGYLIEQEIKPLPQRDEAIVSNLPESNYLE